jgi:hypothetical protein
MPNSMNITPPVVGVTAGPEWAQEINNILTNVIAEHNHQPTQDAINITDDFSINGHQLINVDAVGLATLNSPASGTNRLYNDSGDLYYTDGNNTNVRITQNGGLAAASFGGISNLSGTSGSAEFAGSSTFIWKKDATAYATMENGPVKIYSGNDAAPTAGTTLVGTDGLVSDITMSLSPFNLELPQVLPANNSFVSLTPSGILTASVSQTKGIVRSMVQSGSIDTDQVVASAPFTTPFTWTYSGLDVTITTTGNPILLSLQGYGSSNGGGSPTAPAGIMRIEATTPNTPTKALWRWAHTTGSTTTFFGDTELMANNPTQVDPTYVTFDAVVNGTYIYQAPAGTHRFRVQAQIGDNAANAIMYYVGLVATEL